jgi:CBS-domain-containing membrane protein
MMKCPVRTLSPVSTVEEIKAAMGLPVVHTFPIVNDDEKLLGVISRESLMVLVGNKVWVERDLNSKVNLEKF